MEYTIGELSNLSGVSRRALRYYDEINLLKPAKVNIVGYRIYGEKEVNKLQQILFYKNMNLNLDKIKNILEDPNFDEISALEEQYGELLKEKVDLEKLIKNIEKTIKYKRGEIKMNNKEKFEGFKEEKIRENEELYGDEIRAKYGEEVIKKSNEKFMAMNEEQMKEMKKVEEELFSNLKKLMNERKNSEELEKEIYECHKKWLSYSWSKYSKEAHIGLAQMYLYDDRFKAYYDERVGEGATEILTKVICQYSSK